jgi:hypothetical protein
MKAFGPWDESVEGAGGDAWDHLCEDNDLVLDTARRVPVGGETTGTSMQPRIPSVGRVT